MCGGSYVLKKIKGRFSNMQNNHCLLYKKKKRKWILQPSEITVWKCLRKGHSTPGCRVRVCVANCRAQDVCMDAHTFYLDSSPTTARSAAFPRGGTSLQLTNSFKRSRRDDSWNVLVVCTLYIHNICVSAKNHTSHRPIPGCSCQQRAWKGTVIGKFCHRV